MAFVGLMTATTPTAICIQRLISAIFIDYAYNKRGGTAESSLRVYIQSILILNLYNRTWPSNALTEGDSGCINNSSSRLLCHVIIFSHLLVLLMAPAHVLYCLYTENVVGNFQKRTRNLTPSHTHIFLYTHSSAVCASSCSCCVL